MRSLGFATLAAALCAAFAGAQPASRKQPAVYAGTERASHVVARPPGIRLALRKANEFALAPLSQAEATRLAQPSTLLRTGIHRSLAPAAMSTGAWETTSEGGQVWRMAIRSPGSEGIRVEFRNFSVGGGKVWLHNGSQVAGPYTGRGLFDNGHFWSATVFSESVTIEYEPELGAPQTAQPPFEINSITHRARVTGATRRTLDGQPQAGPPVDPAAACHLDPNCYPEWQPTMSTVAELLFEQDGDEFLCSGSAIATRDDSFKPYLLTAGHCIHSEEAARSLETFWTYQTSSCGGTPPLNRKTSAQSSVGGHLMASGAIESGDYSLVLLKDVPAGVTFAGWDMGDPGMGAPLTGIHHPKGSWKRISFGNRVGDETVDVEDSIAPANLYLQVSEQKGKAEPGSSGSPLFSSPGVIVGTLSYGPEIPGMSVCEIDPLVVGYARFSNAYTHLKDYLENLPAAEIKPSQTDLQFTVANQKAPDSQIVTLSTQSPGTIAYKLRADAPWIRLGTDSGTASQGVPAQVEISVDPSKFDRPGSYTSTVSILSGSAAPQFINVTADVRATQSNVSASVSPAPVVQSGGVWNFTIRLTESAGAATHVTAVKVNGTDYSSSITAWFGTDHIDANGVLEAPLTAAGRFPAGYQYFEFYGVDDDSGSSWYRVAGVRFK